MDQPQPDPGPHAAEYPRSQHTDEKHRVGVVAEGQQPLRLRPGGQPAAIEFCRRLGADGIAPDEPQQQRRAAGAGDAEQRLHQPRQPGGGQLTQPQRQQQGGDHHKGKERRDDGPRTEGQPLLHHGPHLVGARQEPHQQAAQTQAGQYPPSDPHLHHPPTPYAAGGDGMRSGDKMSPANRRGTAIRSGDVFSAGGRPGRPAGIPAWPSGTGDPR